jgi:hypothetical protein
MSYKFTYKGETYNSDPRNLVIEGWNEETSEPIIGSQTLQEKLGMTDAEVIEAHKEGNFSLLVRPERDKLLLESDWTQGTDSPLSDSKKAEWRTYRQALRDMTTQSDPENVIWPNKP